MKAVVVVEKPEGNTLAVQTVADPTPGPNDLLIAVKAVGLNRADLARRPMHFANAGPFIPGLETTGEVIGMGANVKGFAKGDRVTAMAGSTYAERSVADHRLALKVPASMSWAEAASIPVWYLTAHDAIVVNGAMQKGEAVLIQAAAAGVGIAGVQIAKALGAGMVLGTSSSDAKLAKLKSVGVDVGINTKTQNFAKVAREATKDKGVDVIMDNVGASVLAGNLEAAAIKARIVDVGRLGGKEAPIDLDLLALKRIKLIGVTFRSRSLEEKIELNRRAMADLWPLLESGKMKPIVDRTFAFDAALEAQTYMQSNAHFGKIVLLV